MKQISLFVTAALMSVMVSAQNVWNLDKAHASLGFKVTHLLISEVDGSFKGFDVKITGAKDDFSDATIEVTVDVSTINTNSTDRDGHLKSADFFDVAAYPTITFKAKSLQKLEGKNYRLAGQLTMRGITKPVTLDVTFYGTAIHPYIKKTVAGFKATAKINRTEFGIGSSTPAAIVGDEIQIEANFEMIKN
jgi:polyisoprenoid-binding protein YceI